MTDSGRTARAGTLAAMAHVGDDGRVCGEEPVHRELTFLVDRMGCRRCVREVSRRLRDVPGVATVEADAASTRVRMTGTMTTPDVLAALAGTPYTPYLPQPGPAPDQPTGR